MRNPSRRRRQAQRSDCERLSAASAKIPTDNKEWYRERDRWKSALLESDLTAATKLVGLVIADRTINRRPHHANFGLGWASVATLANWTNLSERTVSSALAALAGGGWIALRRGIGLGNSNKYGLLLERADKRPQEAELEHSAQVQYPQNLQPSLPPKREGATAEKNDVKPGKSQKQNLQDLRTTPFKLHENMRRQVKSEDHHRLACALGNGDVECGYLVMAQHSPDEIERYAISLREHTATSEQVRNAFGLPK